MVGRLTECPCEFCLQESADLIIGRLPDKVLPPLRRQVLLNQREQHPANDLLILMHLLLKLFFDSLLVPADETSQSGDPTFKPRLMSAQDDRTVFRQNNEPVFHKVFFVT